jgi:ACT domain-containing protein
MEGDYRNGNVSYIEDPKRLRQIVKPVKAMMENPKSNVEDAAKQVDMTRDTAYEGYMILLQYSKI